MAEFAADAFASALRRDRADQPPWDVPPVRRRIAERMTTSLAPDAWAIDGASVPEGRPDTGRRGSSALRSLRETGQLSGRGEHARRLRRASCSVRWHLFLPEEWADDGEGRASSRRCRAYEKWLLALDILDELAAWDVSPPVNAQITHLISLRRVPSDEGYSVP
ncbi:transposase [Streptomyces sp. NPDC087263]|uniref:transposase n=1 Tax=Streptomyces sp. NPDC087263 TaxID=3365773 RepID=UPI003823DA59